jgi:MSHA biogenesis protein MshJ
MAKLKALLLRIDDMSLQERILLLAAVLVLAAFAWERWLMQPLDAQSASLSRQLSDKHQQIAALDAQSARIVERSQHDPDADTRARIAEVRRQLQAAEEQFAVKTADLIEPRMMASVLETVLEKFERLEFVGVESLTPEPLVKLEGGAAPAAAGAFRHGMRIRFAGSYLDMLAYLEALEALPYGFFWESVDYEVGEFPDGEGSVVVYTLSRYSDWIGA